MTQTGLYYNDALTPVDPGVRNDVFQYVRNSIVPSILQDDKEIQKHIIYHRVILGDSVAKCTKRFAEQDPSTHLLCIYAYGPHIQKMVSAVEVYKKTLGQTKVTQWNKMTMFRLVEPGVNELLEKKTIVPILVTFITTSEALNSPVFDNDLHQFTKQ